MVNFSSDKIKNIGVVSHGGAGKSSLIESILYDAKIIGRLSKLDGTKAIADSEPEEVERGTTIFSKIFPLEWQECKINLIDTPGFPDFVAEVRRVLPVVESLLIVLDGVSGVQMYTKKLWQFAQELNIPVVFFINKMDKENANFEEVSKMCQEQLSSHIVPMSMSLGLGADFKGVVNLLTKKVYGDGELSAGNKEKAESLGQKLTECIVETDDALMEQYLEGKELSEEKLYQTLLKGIKERVVFPIFCGSAIKNIGVDCLLEAIVNFFPAASERTPGLKSQSDEKKKAELSSSSFSALAFKSFVESHVGEMAYIKVFSGELKSGEEVLNSTKGQKEKVGQICSMLGKQRKDVGEVGAGDIVALTKLKNTRTGDTLCGPKNILQFEFIQFPQPITSVAVTPKEKKDQEKMGMAFSTVMLEDPTFKYHIDQEFGQTIIEGLGELHLDMVVKEIKRKYGVNVNLEKPKIAYRETIRRKAKVQGKFKRQSGGRGQYGDVWLEIEPLPQGADFEFINKIFGGAVPSKYIPAVEKGVRGAMKEGVLTGYPLVHLRVTIYDGTYHPVDSSDMAFQIAASMALKKGVNEAGLVLLEPIMEVRVSADEKYLGDITGDLSSRRGKIMGVEIEGGIQVIKAQVPLSEMYKYAADLKSLTQGTGTYSMGFSCYEEVPARITQEKIAEYQKRKEKKE